jgi:hypothetical protein
MKTSTAMGPRVLVPFLPLLAGVFAASAAAQIAQGNLVVVRIGDGTSPLTNAAQPVFLDEYTTAGTFVQTIAMPTAAAGANQAFTNSGTATSEGNLTVSADGQYLLAGGYGTAPGTPSVVSTTSASVPRVFARVDLLGNVDTSTALGDAFSGNNIRSVASDDGTRFWAAGANGGIAFASALGATTSIAINSTAPTNTRVVNVFNGQLYCSSSSGAFRGVSAVGAGIPTTSGQTITLLPGFPTTGGASTYDFFFADPDTVYAADDRTNGSGGIEKWTRSGGTWTLQYVLALSPTTGCRGLTGVVQNGVATLYATTTSQPTEIVTVTDTGALSPVMTIATAAANTVIRGVRLVTRYSSVSFAGTASPTTFGLPAIGTANGGPQIGNLALQITAGNLAPFGFGFLILDLGVLGAGTPVPGAPATVLVYANPTATFFLLADAGGGAAQPFGIPAVGSLSGIPVAGQVIAFDSLLPDPLPIGTSVGMQLVVGK